MEVVWQGSGIFDHVVLELSIYSSASSPSAAIWLAFWNSDHMVLKLSIRTSASPRRQRSYWGVRVTQDAYFSLLIHAKRLLLVTFCDMTPGNQASFRTHARTDGTTHGWTDRRGSRNSYLDYLTLEWLVFMRSKSMNLTMWKRKKIFSYLGRYIALLGFSIQNFCLP